MSPEDRAIGARAAWLAGQSPKATLRWLGSRGTVSRASLGTDGKTLTVHFRDGSRVAILPSQSSDFRLPLTPAALTHTRAAAGTGSQRAIVLEPFATELGLGPDAGQAEADALSGAGFHVDVLRNDRVTVAALLNLDAYSVVYWDTHSGVLDNGDAVVVTGEADTKPYSAYFKEHTVIQAFVSGDPSMTLYNGITGAFIDEHVGDFPDASIFFLNGCSVLSAPTFWSDVQKQNVSALVSWDRETQSEATQRAAQFVVNRLAAGDTVSGALTEASIEGLGTSVVNDGVSHLGFKGWGGDTLAQALAGAGSETPTATPAPGTTPTPSPTATPVTNPLHVKVLIAKHHIAPGARQTVRVSTYQGSTVTISVTFPNGKTKHHTGQANTSGMLVWHFVEPRGTVRGKHREVVVRVRASDVLGNRATATKKYTTK